MTQPMSPRQKAVIAAATASAVALATPFEGIKFTPYYDPPGILTACRGHTGPDVKKGTHYTLAQCDKWMDDDMHKAVGAVFSCAPNAPESVLIAFGDAVYNIGPKIACNTSASTAARMLKAGEWSGACKQLPRWNRATVAGVSVELPGLTKRRVAESQLCLKGLDHAS